MHGFCQWEMHDVCMPNLHMFVLKAILAYIELKN